MKIERKPVNVRKLPVEVFDVWNKNLNDSNSRHILPVFSLLRLASMNKSFSNPHCEK